ERTVAAAVPNIVIPPAPPVVVPTAPATGAPASQPFSAALQAATQNLLHPSTKLAGSTKPGQASTSSNNSKTGMTTDSQNTAQGTNPLQNLLMPIAPVVPPTPFLQAGAADIANLQSTTVGAEQNQASAQNARITSFANDTSTNSSAGS